MNMIRGRKFYLCKRWGVESKCYDNYLKICCDLWCLGLEENFEGFYFGHVFGETCQYLTTNEKMCQNFKYVYVKSIQSNLQKCITWIKKLKKGKQEWNKVCEDFNICPRNKTL